EFGTYTVGCHADIPTYCDSFIYLLELENHLFALGLMFKHDFYVNSLLKGGKYTSYSTRRYTYSHEVIYACYKIFIEIEEWAFLNNYEKIITQCWAQKELHEVRDVPSGFYSGLAYSGINTLLLESQTPLSFTHKKADRKSMRTAAQPKSDGVISFYLLSNVSPTGSIHTKTNLFIYVFVIKMYQLEGTWLSSMILETDYRYSKKVQAFTTFYLAGLYEYVDNEMTLRIIHRALIGLSLRMVEDLNIMPVSIGTSARSKDVAKLPHLASFWKQCTDQSIQMDGDVSY
ncbi:Electron transfer flavoprotein-ubiquinone oxidoreductase, mitochondrial, partial [Choanephora cucurbitarum]